MEETVAPVNSVEPSIAPSVSANVEPTTTTNNVVENKAEEEVVTEEAEDTVLYQTADVGDSPHAARRDGTRLLRHL